MLWILPKHQAHIFLQLEKLFSICKQYAHENIHNILQYDERSGSTQNKSIRDVSRAVRTYLHNTQYNFVLYRKCSKPDISQICRVGRDHIQPGNRDTVHADDGGMRCNAKL